MRNARDWTEEKRKELIAAANGKVPDVEHLDLVSSTQSFVSLLSNEATHLESETSADELALDVRVISYNMAQIDLEYRRRLRRSLGYLCCTETLRLRIGELNLTSWKDDESKMMLATDKEQRTEVGSALESFLVGSQ